MLEMSGKKTVQKDWTLRPWWPSLLKYMVILPTRGPLSIGIMVLFLPYLPWPVWSRLCGMPQEKLQNTFKMCRWPSKYQFISNLPFQTIQCRWHHLAPSMSRSRLLVGIGLHSSPKCGDCATCMPCCLVWRVARKLVHTKWDGLTEFGMILVTKSGWNCWNGWTPLKLN